MKIANYTTKVDSNKSVTEIQQMLGMAGAQAIMIEYTENEPSSVAFKITRPTRNIAFKLPCDWKRTLRVIHADRKVPPRLKTPQQAKRIAWRILRDWLRSQLSLIEIDCADVEQVFLPYAVTPTGETLYEQVKNSEFSQFQIPQNV